MNRYKPSKQILLAALVGYLLCYLNIDKWLSHTVIETADYLEEKINPEQSLWRTTVDTLTFKGWRD